MLVTVFRGVHRFGARELSGQFLRGMNKDGKTLGAHPDIAAHELQCDEWDNFLRAPAIQALLSFDCHDSPCNKFFMISRSYA